MSTHEIALPALLARSVRMCAAWADVRASLGVEEDDELLLRGRLCVDACDLTLEHGNALRLLIDSGLENAGLAMLRIQHEALLRAAWVAFAATDDVLLALAAPHTPGTLARANDLPLSHKLLEQVEHSDAPGALKRGLREFRDVSWKAVNSYAHAGLLPLGRASQDHPESQLVQGVQVSNAHSYAAHMLIATTFDSHDALADLNVIALSHPGCMRAAPRA